MLTAEELRELRKLQITAGRKVDSLFGGDYRSAVRGRGMEFEEVREYYPGDDVRHIDWNVTARTHQPHVKVFREERQATVMLCVDVSGSTRVGTGGRDGRTSRRLQMARVAGGLAYASIRNRDTVGLVTFTDRIEKVLVPRKSRGHAWAVIQAAYEGKAHGRGTDLATALGHVSRVQRRRAVLVVVSDFLDPGPWPRILGAMCRKHTVHAVLVHGGLDERLPDLGLVDVYDPETGRVRTVDARMLAAGPSVESRMSALRRAGARALALSLDEDPFLALHQHFQRMRRGR